MNTTTQLNAAIEAVERQLKLDTIALQQRAQRLASDMANLALRAEQGRLSGVNSLGEVQGQGASVDTACAKLAANLETLEYLRAIAKEK